MNKKIIEILPVEFTPAVRQNSSNYAPELYFHLKIWFHWEKS